MTKTMVKIQRILMRIGALESVQSALAARHAPKLVGEILVKSKLQMTKTIIKIPPIEMRVGALESSEPALAPTDAPRLLGEDLQTFFWMIYVKFY